MSKINEKLNQIRKIMNEDNVDYYIIFTADPHGSEYINDYYKFREYISDFTGSAGTVIIGKDFAGLWTDGRYFLQAEKQLDFQYYELFRLGEEGVPSILQYLKSVCKNNSVLAYDGRMCSADYDKKIKDSLNNIYTIRNDIDYSKHVFKNRKPLCPQQITFLSREIAGQACNYKIDSVKASLQENDAFAYIECDLSNIMWLFNLRGNDIPFSPVAFSYSIIYSDKMPVIYLHKNALSSDITNKIQECGIIIRDYSLIYEDISLIKNQKIICDPSKCNAYIYSIINEANTIVDVKSHVIIKKHIKNEHELLLQKKYHIIDGLAVTKWIYTIKNAINEGQQISEYEAANLMNSLRSCCCDFIEPSFETICAYGKNSAVIHYTPSKTNSDYISKSSFVLLDSGGQYLGATTDVTRTISFGNVSNEMKEAYTLVLKGHLNLLNAVFLEGTTGENLDILARSALWNNHLDYRHGTGHGVGSYLNVHEDPTRISYKSIGYSKNIALKEGIVTSNEPGVYLKDKFGIRIENMMFCKKHGESEWGTFLCFENLTFVPYEMDAVIPDILNKEEKELLNRINNTTYDLYKDKLNELERNWLYNITRSI